MTYTYMHTHIHTHSLTHTYTHAHTHVTDTHTQVFHWSSLYMEFYSIFKRVKQIKYFLLAILMWILKLIFLNIRGSNRVGFHTCFGDSSEIPQRYIAHLHELVWRNLIFNRWKKGDVLMIDNYRVSHGRQVGICGGVLSCKG